MYNNLNGNIILYVNERQKYCLFFFCVCLIAEILAWFRFFFFLYAQSFLW